MIGDVIITSFNRQSDPLKGVCRGSKSIHRTFDFVQTILIRLCYQLQFKNEIIKGVTQVMALHVRDTRLAKPN